MYYYYYYYHYYCYYYHYCYYNYYLYYCYRCYYIATTTMNRREIVARQQWRVINLIQPVTMIHRFELKSMN